ncbi:MAG: aspartate-alanine antiporter [Gammaproteobacteria bacterium]
MQWLVESLRAHPELALFLALALGHGAGRLRVGSFQLGPVLGSLLAGVVVGQLAIPVPEALKNALFLLFLFSIGYTTGPLFFRGLKTTALPQVALTLILCVTALLTAWAVSRAFGFDPGQAGGLVAGAMTSSAALGTAGDSVAKLAVAPEVLAQLGTSQTVAFAVTYLIGMGLVVWLLSSLAPRLLRVDLKAECRKLEEEMGVTRSDAGGQSAYAPFVARVYEVGGDTAGRAITDIEALFAGQRVFVERFRRDGRISDDPPAGTVLRAGDRVVLSGRREVLSSGENPLQSREVDDPELLDIPVMVVDVFVTQKDAAGRTLADLGSDAHARGVFLRRLTRAGAELPFTPGTVVERGDVLRLAGAKRNIERIATQIGIAEWPTAASDMTTVSIAILLGGLVGLPALSLGKLELGLSLFVGVLLGGLVFGWLRSIWRVFGYIPEPALWVFDSFGLTGFLALVGIEAGPDFIRGITESGVSLVIAGILVTTVPHLVTLLVGRYVFRLHPGILIGVCCGAGTSAPALAAVQEVADSRIPALGYGVGCALGNVILALWGGVIVLLIQG